MCSGVFVEAAAFPVNDKGSFADSCAAVAWPHFLKPHSSFLVSAQLVGTNRFLHSDRYASQLVKDGISHHFGRALGKESPSVSFRDPEVRLLLHVEHGEARVLVDAVGVPTSARSYRYKPAISDIDPTVAVALLHDIGFTSYESNCYDLSHYERSLSSFDRQDTSPAARLPPSADGCGPADPEVATALHPGRHGSGNQIDDTRSDLGRRVSKAGELPVCSSNSPKVALVPNAAVVDLFSGCGTFLIEAAMIAARIAPGALHSSFSFQSFAICDEVALQRLRQYASERRLATDSDEYRSLRGKFVGVESCWEKVEASLYSAEKAGVLDLLRVLQADYLKDGLYDAHRARSDGERWCYLIAQLPRLKSQFSSVPDTSETSSEAGTGGERGGVTTADGPAPDFRRAGRRGTAVAALDPQRYYRLLNHVAKFKRRLFEEDARCVLVAPSVVQLPEISGAWGHAMHGGRRFVKAGVPCTVYYSRRPEHE
ncbi:bifunctional 23S rRNA (guanine(2069)-N(7))-methyltransferase RlmK/23S rRNA (guanine(2445)-N(2))-methyltransferase RlmL [Babesia caballi]|uniref:Bifunctional 23S rRNA (Guanine(2069)-N(7))-methyltransferase RlmK/23S rRNA (Guanine(2445)-N(2))-methyltransferase RlmL n=1 Tax=Babesia caballi TaxID=5871 RepID=A0AAV4LNG1_BABCB|nr:bifunctional 23S rRNA (guanine(2069)-N(7))-methyltransferase RlmK/23S rRNA (guanine(2445)-N(2))-methyltransferase RlmL [Babesia caballi]